MVSAIGATTLAQAPALRAASSKTQTAANTTAPAASAADDAGTDAASVPGAQAAAVTRVGDQLDAQFGAARVQRAQGDASPAAVEGSAAEGSAVDYIAEADTNKDRKVSEQERIAYAKKQASEAQQANKAPDAAQQSRAQEAQQSRAQEMQQEAQQAYLPQETPGSRLDISA